MGDWEDIFGVGVDAEDVIDDIVAEPYEHVYSSRDRRIFFQSYSALADWESQNKNAIFSRRPLGDGFEVEILEQVTEKDHGIFQCRHGSKKEVEILFPCRVFEGIEHRLLVAPETCLLLLSQNAFTLAKTVEGMAAKALLELCKFLEPGRVCQWPIHVERRDLAEIRDEQNARFFHPVKWGDVMTSCHGVKATAFVAQDGTALLGLHTENEGIAIQPWIFDINFDLVLGVGDQEITQEILHLLRSTFVLSDYINGEFQSPLDVEVQKWVAQLTPTNVKFSAEVLPPFLARSKVELDPLIEERLKNFARRIEESLQAKVDEEEAYKKPHFDLLKPEERKRVSFRLCIEPVLSAQCAAPTLKITPTVSTFEQNPVLGGGKSYEEEELEGLIRNFISDGGLNLAYHDIFSIDHMVWCGRSSHEFLHISKTEVKAKDAEGDVTEFFEPIPF